MLQEHDEWRKNNRGCILSNKGPKARHHISVFFPLSKTSYMATSGFTKKLKTCIYSGKLNAEIKRECFIAHLCEKRQ